MMRRAIALAKRGRGRTSPNPMVGCVLVKRGRIVGEGFHKKFGGSHAEPQALAQAGTAARGATAYVNLEPCCYFGKTPACTKVLIAAGITRVVFGVRDPNPKVAGKGKAALRRAGIDVEEGMLAKKCESLNRGFFSWIRKGRPYVILKVAASLDGRIQTSSGESKWITSPQARALSRKMRAEVDAILVGRGTVIADDPRLTASGSRHPLRIVLDTNQNTPKTAKLLKQPGTSLIVSSKAPNGRLPATDSVEHLRVPKRGTRLDLKKALAAIAARGVTTLLVEGGSDVHTSFLEAGLVDEVRLFLAPSLLGGKTARSFFEGKGFDSLKSAPRLTETSIRRIGPDFLLTGRIA
ncbi:MAG: riboflavin biosynthesis protein RibD [Elusimicrobia bacterium]|nr:MAG: riboflavin biosynthesis protein RibD [Elusimicrobiota bacterium]